MGQSKFNPTAQLAKEGKIPPKKPTMSKREVDRRVMGAIKAYLDSPFTRLVGRFYGD